MADFTRNPENLIAFPGNAVTSIVSLDTVAAAIPKGTLLVKGSGGFVPVTSSNAATIAASIDNTGDAPALVAGAKVVVAAEAIAVGATKAAVYTEGEFLIAEGGAITPNVTNFLTTYGEALKAQGIILHDTVKPYTEPQT